MFATRAAARISLRSPVLRRPIHSGVRGDWGRTSAATIGFVAAAGAGAIGTYVSYKSGGNKETDVVQKYSEAKRSTTKSAAEPASKAPSQKSQDNTSVDSQAPVKSSPSEPGVIESSNDKPAPKKEDESTPEGGMDDLEADAESQGAFNPETGEINWDCPCLGGMAHGPCGPQFREAFSCFVHSNEEPKGVDCVEKFKAMQDCFREHPEVYGEELDDDDEASDATKEAKADDGATDKPVGEKGGKGGKEKNEEKPEAKVAAAEDAPAPPNPSPESRANAHTAKVSPEKTPSKSAAKH
ncbi:hypothetical protein ACGC1H_006902 [Rhizoctonia solani]|uniref:Mitochondrial intermembrane space import and assembly protein 40 n=1 Tax=Rhizoctonia solani TaxID=456999 RepID=A0A8H3ATD1_9AGAM|nr:unnamed protein product [Rhizoctonia solani]